MLTAVILIVSVAVVLVLVLLVVVVVAIRQEPRDMEMSDMEMSDAAPSLIAVVVRRMLGVYLRRPPPPADSIEERVPDAWPSALPPSRRR
jgi:hypothetical protein